MAAVHATEPRSTFSNLLEHILLGICDRQFDTGVFECRFPQAEQFTGCLMESRAAPDGWFASARLSLNYTKRRQRRVGSPSEASRSRQLMTCLP